MTLLAIILSLALAVLIIGQLAITAGFVARLRRPPATPLPDDHCPKVALVICVRGKDPTLAECLEAALGQNYPDYVVHIIVDNITDPAFTLVRDLVTLNPKASAKVQILRNPLHSCSLKCSSLIQAISGLDDSVEVVAFLDTDIVPHRNWIRALTAPLADPKIGASTGNRWFVPRPSSLATLARFAWNAGAVALMHRLKIAWGGSLAIKRSVIEQGHLLSRWSGTYCEDTAIDTALRQLGLQLEFVPSNIAVDRDDCTFSPLLKWVTRQLLACRLHHRGWWGVVSHGLGTSLTLGLSLFLVVMGAIFRQWEAAGLVALVLVAYLGMLAWILAWLDSSVALAASSYQLVSDDFRWSGLMAWKLFPSILLAQIIYGWGLARATFANRVEWRGVEYQIDNLSGIRMVEYLALPGDENLRSSRQSASVGKT